MLSFAIGLDTLHRTSVTSGRINPRSPTENKEIVCHEAVHSVTSGEINPRSPTENKEIVCHAKLQHDKFDFQTRSLRGMELFNYDLQVQQ